MTKITPCLWFDRQALEAAEFYTALFHEAGKPARIGRVTHYGPNMPLPDGTVLTVEFDLAGLPFLALNGGAAYAFNPAISMSVSCVDQDELDFFWSRLLDGGQPVQCGWLTDRYGLSWQVVPEIMPELIQDMNPDARNRTMSAMMGMIKLDIAALQAAHAG
ncbi:VOC family protein [Pseudoroseomonas globiformis]|uniref:VOC family protein n=1 Tax=Teichococcus globiformis TaxID=2307229 RepID=A0ABV7FU00_9PROT